MPIQRTTKDHKCLVVFMVNRFPEDLSDLARAMSDASRFSQENHVSAKEALAKIKAFPAKFQCIQLTDKINNPELAPISLISASDYETPPNISLVTTQPAEELDSIEPVRYDMSRTAKGTPRKTSPKRGKRS